MSFYLNPFSITLTLLERESQLLFLPYIPQPNHPLHLQDHLQHLVECVKQAAQKNYCFLCTLFPSSDTSLYSPPLLEIPTLLTFVKELTSWIATNKSMIISSCSDLFFQDISQSLLMTQSLIENPEHTLMVTKTALEITSSSSTIPLNPKKRWLTTHEKETSITKKTKISCAENNTIEQTPSLIQKTTSSCFNYLVQDIVMLEDAIFTFIPTIIQDIEEWISIIHQHLGTIIANFDIVIVDAKIDLHALPYESLRNLRIFSLQSILAFMQEHQDILESLPHPETKKEIQQSHTQLMADIETALEEIEEDDTLLTPPFNQEEELLECLPHPEQKIRQSYTQLITDITTTPEEIEQDDTLLTPPFNQEEELLECLPHPEQKIRQSYTQLITDITTTPEEIEQDDTLLTPPFNQEEEPLESITSTTLEPQSIPAPAKKLDDIKWLIGLRLTSGVLSLNAIQVFVDASRFKQFLLQVKKASLASAYKSLLPIPNIPEKITNNHPAVLHTLYHIVSRNTFCFSKQHLISPNLEEFISSTFDMLNQKYCAALKIDSDPLNHHEDLIKLIVSNHKPPFPIIIKPSIRYISVYIQRNNHQFIRIQETAVRSPMHQTDTSLKNWFASLKKHHSRIHSILQKSLNTSLYLLSKDNAWPLNHDDTKPVTCDTLVKTLLDISRHNLEICPSYFRDQEIKHPGYAETLSLLLSIKEMLQNPVSSSLTTKKFSKEINSIRKARSCSSKYFFKFCTLARSGSSYHFLISRTVRSKKNETLKALCSVGNRLFHHIVNIFTEPFFPKIKETKESHIYIKQPLFIALIYLATEYNLFLTQKKFENTFLEIENNYSKESFFKAIKKFDQIKQLLLKQWAQIEPKKSMPALESIDHPVATSISCLYQKFDIKKKL
ncbi:hypothetical protein CLAVI_000906 [Candidatus Clavichlamydia salmonicola]|uniref:hypothetical protein n=1 Tax=Candidatus Clavichlamydia salmonicola TaxID=469812 RepID=UPI0018917C71|nr:hypothetical protein [Candidatus Clavichlamydia salmonicola]MBF5051265.1 hypothetical protein [Candidatus Clavichlamydia salmonicola]